MVANPASELGTIMSYCNNVNFTQGFGTEPGALIRVLDAHIRACLIAKAKVEAKLHVQII